MATPEELERVSMLGQLLADLPLNADDQWNVIEHTAKTLADDLRRDDVDKQTMIGQGLIAQTLHGLLQGALAGAPIPHQRYKSVVYEILRLGANICRDHDVNRGSLLEAGFPQTVVSLLEGYAETIDPNDPEPMRLPLDDLRLVRTAIAVLLNCSLEYEPVRTRLISLEAAMVILKLSIAIYPPGSWARETHVPVEGSKETAEVVEAWDIRRSLTSWAWLCVFDWEGGDEHDKSRQLLTADILPHFSRALQAFVPPYPSPPQLFSSPESRKAFVQVDVEVLEQVSGQLERLALDVEEVRIELGRGFVSPQAGSESALSRMLTFIEYADYPTYWTTDGTTEELEGKKKGFDRSKAAVVKAVVEVAGDDKNTDVLWDNSKEGKPGGDFVETMVRWIRSHSDQDASRRDDLLICALVNLGNLCRRDSHSIAIVNPPVSLTPHLVSLLKPTTDMKVLHGVLGLLKHLATSPANRSPLGQAGVLTQLASSEVIHPRADTVELSQMSAIGLAKHLCNGNIDNALTVCLPDPSVPDSRPLLDHILDLGRRSDSTAIKSESTRVAVNIIKSLWTTDISSTTEDPASLQQKRDAARKALVSTSCASALAQLIGRSRKYPMLVNEGVVALTLLSTGENGGAIALDALLNPLPTEAGSGPHRQPSLPPISAGGILSEPMNVDGSPISSTPRRAFDMLTSFLHNVPFNFQPSARSAPQAASLPLEVRANICSLLGHLGRKGVVVNRERDVEMLKESTRGLLERLAGDGGPESRSAVAAKRALDAWAKV